MGETKNLQDANMDFAAGDPVWARSEAWQTFVAGVVVCSTIALTGCLRLDIPSPAPGDSPGMPPSGVPEPTLHIAGPPELARADFARAHPASRAPFSRLIGTSVVNRTGSVADLLRPALLAELRRRAKDSRDPVTGELLVSELGLDWFPPQEFIKIPQAKRQGVVTAVLGGTWTVRRGSRPGAVHRFRISLRERAFPGQEGVVMSQLMGVVLESFLREVRGVPTYP